MNNADLLATAIVDQAIDDYDFALRTIKRLQHERNLTTNERNTLERAVRYKEDVERFLNSEWQAELTPGIDGKTLLRQIQDNFRQTGRCRLKDQKDFIGDEETA